MDRCSGCSNAVVVSTNSSQTLFVSLCMGQNTWCGKVRQLKSEEKALSHQEYGVLFADHRGFSFCDFDHLHDLSCFLGPPQLASHCEMRLKGLKLCGHKPDHWG